MDEALAATLDPLLERHDFSGAVHVARAGRDLYLRARGLADRAHGIPNTTVTRFAVASGAKGFTALAAMSLVAEGALSLHTPARTLLGGDLPLIDPAVTVRHLLSHTSGIGDYIDEDAGGTVSDHVLPVPVHRLARARDYLQVLDGHPQAFPPGEGFAYCNGAYVVLALLVEAASGRDYHEVVSERVFAPAGMTETAFLRSDRLPGTAATCYLEDDGGWYTNVLHMPAKGLGDGGAYSTLADMARFWAALHAGRIVSPAVVEEMTRPQARSGQGAVYGFGFWLTDGRRTAMLEGYDAGISFRSAADPDSGFQYTVVSNTSEGAWPIAGAVEEAVAAAS